MILQICVGLGPYQLINILLGEIRLVGLNGFVPEASLLNIFNTFSSHSPKHYCRPSLVPKQPQAVIHTHRHTHTYTHTHIHTHTHIYMHTHTHAHIHAYIYMHTHIHAACNKLKCLLSGVGGTKRTDFRIDRKDREVGTGTSI